jgi:hypothetical protein
MVIQYKGFNDGWCYEEADTVYVKTLFVSDLLDHYKDCTELNDFSEMYDKLNLCIQNECSCDSPVYLTKKETKDLDRINVVILGTGSKCSIPCGKVYVFDSDFYLLNDSGKTVQHIY